MSLFAQHGYGKSSKVTNGIADGILSGVILSPRDEAPRNMLTFIGELDAANDVELLFDPQFYVSTVPADREGHLPEYPYYVSGLTPRDLISPARITNHVEEIINYQMELPLTKIIGPSVIFNGIDDRQSQVALSFAAASCEYHSTLGVAPPLLLTLAVSENAFRSQESVDALLDILTSFETTGFYIVLVRGTIPNVDEYEPEILANLLYSTYSLSVLNEYEVIWGFTDLTSILFHAVGARASACGWYNNLCHFSLGRYLDTGGRRARQRYTSMPMLSKLLLIPELNEIYEAGLLNQVLSRTPYDEILGVTRPGDATWSSETNILNHWFALNQILEELSAMTETHDRLDFVQERIFRAIGLYTEMGNQGIEFERTTGPRHLEYWREGTANFRATMGL